MNIAISSDHAGFTLKPVISQFLTQLGYRVIDNGSYDPNPVDFPDIAKRVCENILNRKAKGGIMICGTGVGAAIACNKISGIRASVEKLDMMDMSFKK